ncbi:MAG: AMP-binding protein [Paludibacteraceae bacterium]|nr:AMP-binding protein [Paludibacteraceae bacterium]
MKKTIVDVFENSVKNYPNNTFLMEKEGSEWKNTTYQQVQTQVYQLGAGFQALGVKKGDNMALLSEGRNLWVISELAMFYAGAVNVPLSIKLEENNDLLFRLQHGDAKYIITSGQQLKKIRQIADQLELLQKVIVLDEQTEYRPNEIYVGDVMKLGEKFIAENGKEKFMEVAQSIANDDLATITYTSGTTADPKGVCLTHRNYTANVEQCLSRVPIDHTWRTLIILPLDHCFAHVVGFYVMMMQGAAAATVQVGRTPMETLKNIPINIKEVRPHYILSVPALAKSFKKNIEQGISKQGKLAERLFSTGQKIRQCYYGESNLDSKGLKVLLKPIVALFDKILFDKVRENFGGELRFFIGGGALLDKDLQKFYIGIGLPMFQGYGLSEATPVISTNTPDYFRFGSSGKLVEPITVKICDADGKELPTGQQGEIVVKGENVMAGYWKNETATADTVKDGWLYTGDLGYMTEEGLLYVKGRFKSLLISSDGEKYSPEGIEEALVQMCGTIDQVMLYNNQNPTTSALIVPNKAELKNMGYDLTTDEGCSNALHAIMNEINQFKKGGVYDDMFPDRWMPSSIAVLKEPFSEQNHMINSTMKMVRGVIEKTYADRIAYIYTAEGKKVDNELNMQAIKE